MTREPTNLALRVAPLAWAHASTQGRLTGLQWVDSRLVPDRTDHRQINGEDEPPAFRQASHLGTLPPSVAEAALDAQAEGQVTGWEAMVLLFAWPEWVVAARDHVWAPWSPVPKLLAPLVEAFGIESSLHRYDGARLGRLAALLPRWHPHRGTVARAAEILDAAGEGSEMERVVTPLPDEEAAPEAEATAPSETAHEVFACRSEAWWMARAENGSEPIYRISGGLLRFQPRAGKAFRVRKEDLLVKWTPGDSIPRGLLRLLPVWTVARAIANTEKNA